MVLARRPLPTSGNEKAFFYYAQEKRVKAQPEQDYLLGLTCPSARIFEWNFLMLSRDFSTDVVVMDGMCYLLEL